MAYPVFGKTDSKNHPCPCVRDVRGYAEAPEMGLAPGRTPCCAMPEAPAYTLFILVA